MPELLIARHCAPALAGIKPSNIVTCKKRDIPNFHEKLAALNEQLRPTDIHIDILCECDRRAILIVYKKRVLTAHLADKKSRAFLSKFGYESSKTLEDYLNVLKTHLALDDFPHEIGVFLGYPLRDIYCFINHRDKGCLLTGDWRVYHNPEEAKKTFMRFKACKKSVSDKLLSGKTLAQIFRAA